ncbi:serine/threonine protein kinase [Halobacillus sp. A1]|uniref:Serine/threonine protein kinase n=1 Tax=Halobacillus campisalis TaxID=435909 RepID=A0ABW2K761_9BACI|nr:MULTISPECIES: serine/threonine protein kinase [Halobacillus]MCP3031328.1 serine/threonine protein kinase [Halobacillus sp. A1]
MNTKTIKELVEETLFIHQKVDTVPNEFTLIGQGRSAAVFRMEGSPDYAVKVFYPEFKQLAHQEAAVYERLSHNKYYPELVEVGEGYLVLEYLNGMTFYECLVAGIPITPLMVAMVDDALGYARSQGLNPSDIHLKNIMLTNNNQIKVIDVVRFTQDKDCPHWSDLKKAYFTYYQKKYFPKRFAPIFLELIIRLYRKRLLPI